MFKSKKRKGFSLVELVVVILIIAVLASAVFLGGATVIRQSRESAVKTDLRNYASYVQDMMYSTPALQANSKYAEPESTTYNKASGEATKMGKDDKLPVLDKLNGSFLTGDFSLGEKNSKKDPWSNGYCYSFYQKAGTKHSCAVIIISSMGSNGNDETVCGDSGQAAAGKLAEKLKDDNVVLQDAFSADMFIAYFGKDASAETAAEAAGTSGGESGAGGTGGAAALAVSSTATNDDYGVVIMMYDGSVSTAYFGFPD